MQLGLILPAKTFLIQMALKTSIRSLSIYWPYMCAVSKYHLIMKYAPCLSCTDMAKDLAFFSSALHFYCALEFAALHTGA